MFKCWTDEMLESVLLNKYWTEDFRKVQEFAKAEIARRKKEKAMKAYKIDLSMYPGKVREAVSEAVQKKAFELGYHWYSTTSTTQTDRPWLVFNYDGTIAWNHSNTQTIKDYPLIAAADFLNLESAEPEFKPFDKVLMRDAVRGEDDWTLCQYSHFWEETNEHVAMGGLRYEFCIPYEGNEHLLGTTDSK